MRSVGRKECGVATLYCSTRMNTNMPSNKYTYTWAIYECIMHACVVSGHVSDANVSHRTSWNNKSFWLMLQRPELLCSCMCIVYPLVNVHSLCRTMSKCDVVQWRAGARGRANILICSGELEIGAFESDREIASIPYEWLIKDYYRIDAQVQIDVCYLFGECIWNISTYVLWIRAQIDWQNKLRWIRFVLPDIG